MNFRTASYEILKFGVINSLAGLIFKLFYRLGFVKEFVFPYRGELPIRIGSASFKMRSDGSDSVAAKMYMHKFIPFEPEVFNVFESFAPQLRGFFDIGANTGAYSLFVKALNPSCEVFGFEPVPTIFEHFSENIKLNGFESIHCFRMGVGNKNGGLDFYVPKTLRIPTAGSLKASHRPGTEKIRVDVVRLDDFLAQNEAFSVDFIKIDTESTEPAVLEGALECIKRYRPVLLIEVLKEKEGKAIEALLSPLTYGFFQILPLGLNPVTSLSRGDSPGHWNFLLMPNEKVVELKALRKLEIL